MKTTNVLQKAFADIIREFKEEIKDNERARKQAHRDEEYMLALQLEGTNTALE